MFSANNFAFGVKVIIGFESTLNYFTGWVGSWEMWNYNQLTSAKAGVKALVEPGNKLW